MKTARQDKIIELIQNHQIETQEELASRLSEAGFSVTQATVSRDIRALNLTKLPGTDGKSYYAMLSRDHLAGQDKYLRVLTDTVLTIAVGQNILVIRTAPGMAMGAATALDALSWQEVLGSIAGDDTIMCACASSAEAQTVMHRLKKLIPAENPI